MRTLEEIKNRVSGVQELDVIGVHLYAGRMFDIESHKIINVTFGFDEDGYEHAAVSFGNGRKPPTWDIMCKVKKSLWNDDETVVQIHPRETEYFHGFKGACLEVLHMWRPVNGDWSIMNEANI